jgi:hypothetical protein
MGNKHNNQEQVLVESPTLRERYINNVDVLDKLKAVLYLTNDMVVTVEQVANYYEVSIKAIQTVIQRHRDELEDDGIYVLKDEKLEKLKQEICDLHGEDYKISSKTRALTILSRRAFLRIGMLLTTSFVAKQVRNYLLNIEETSSEEQKKWALQREVGKIDRKRMTSAISKYIPESPKKKWAYPEYTNLVYSILFGKTAKELREIKKIKTNDLLRDSFSKEELQLVDEAETIVTALVSLGFNKNYIEKQLNIKFKNIKLLS